MPDATETTPQLLNARNASEARIAAILTAAGLVLTAAFALSSPDGIHHYDDLAHYLLAKWAWQWPAYLLNDWGRPGCTTLYALPAALGWPACRLLSAILSAASAWLAFRIAQRMEIESPWLVVPLCYVQPLFFGLAQTTLSETPLMFYWTAAAYLAQRGRWSWSALFVSIGFTTRHEAIIAAPIWMFVAWRQQVSLWRLWPMVIAPLIVNGLAPLADMKPQWQRLLEPKPSQQYGQGGWLTYFSRSMEAWGLGVTVLAIIGLPRLRRLRFGLLPLTLIALYFGAQTAIRALGLFDSGGYARFLVPISPFVAIAALAGWRWLNDTTIRNRLIPMLWVSATMLFLYLAFLRQMILFHQAGNTVFEVPYLDLAAKVIDGCALALVAVPVMLFAVCLNPSLPIAPPVTRWLSRYMRAVIVVIITLTAAVLWRPLPEPEDAAIVNEMRVWIDEHQLGDRLVISTHVWINYRFGIAMPQDIPATTQRVTAAAPGTLIIWDGQFSETPDHQLHLETLLSSGAYRELYRSRSRRFSDSPQFVILEKLGNRRSANQNAEM